MVLVASPPKDVASPKSIEQSRFLVIGCGNECHGDNAVGIRVAKDVADWQLSPMKSVAVEQLTPKLVADIAEADYVIFVDACDAQSCARTAQLDPIVADAQILGSPHSRFNHSRIFHPQLNSYSPSRLLNLTQQLYDHAPQAWLLQLPTEKTSVGETLSSTAQRGCDFALQTIARFFQSYQRSIYMS